MTRYAKIVCGAVRVPQNYPCSIELDGRTIVNPTDEEYLAAGYLPLEETEPKVIEGKVATASYELNTAGDKIVQSWTYTDAPEEPTPVED